MKIEDTVSTQYKIQKCSTMSTANCFQFFFFLQINRIKPFVKSKYYKDKYYAKTFRVHETIYCVEILFSPIH